MMHLVTLSPKSTIWGRTFFGIISGARGQFCCVLLMSFAGGLLLIYPGLTTDLIGLALVVAVIAIQFLTKKKYAASV